MRYEISVDDEQPQIININADRSQAVWSKDVSDNIKHLVSVRHIGTKEKHLLKYWMVDAAVVLQKIVINAGGAKSRAI